MVTVVLEYLVYILLAWIPTDGDKDFWYISNFSHMQPVLGVQKFVGRLVIVYSRDYCISYILIVIRFMNQNQEDSESLVNLSTLPAELLVYIVSFLYLARDGLNLRYVSRWLRLMECHHCGRRLCEHFITAVMNAW